MKLKNGGEISFCTALYKKTISSKHCNDVRSECFRLKYSLRKRSKTNPEYNIKKLLKNHLPSLSSSMPRSKPSTVRWQQILATKKSTKISTSGIETRRFTKGRKCLQWWPDWIALSAKLLRASRNMENMKTRFSRLRATMAEVWPIEPITCRTERDENHSPMIRNVQWIWPRKTVFRGLFWILRFCRIEQNGE